MVKISQCKFCSKFIEADNRSSLIMSELRWIHVTTRESKCDYPVDLMGIYGFYDSYATPVPLELFPMNGDCTIWLGN